MTRQPLLVMRFFTKLQTKYKDYNKRKLNNINNI